jgi:lipopolysaccharide transport system permease protein
VELGEVWRYRDLLLLLVRRDLLAVYKQSVLGPLWQVVQPLLTSIMFAVIFGFMARMGEPGIPGLLFYMAAVVPWSFFANIINRTGQTLVFNSTLMTKVYYPRIISPISTVLATSVSFGVQLAAYFLFALYYQLTGAFAMRYGADMLLLPVLILMLTALATGFGLIITSLTTKFRDFTFLVTFGVQLLMFMSPVIFPLSRVPEGGKLRQVIELNPMTPVIEGFRAILLGMPMDWGSLFYGGAFALAALLAGVLLFQRTERSFADIV